MVLLSQVLREDSTLSQTIADDYQRYAKSWTSSSLETTLISALDRSSNTFLIFIDGLDEISETQDRRNDLGKIIASVMNLNAVSNVKLCVASRPGILFEKNFTALLR